MGFGDDWKFWVKSRALAPLWKSFAQIRAPNFILHFPTTNFLFCISFTGEALPKIFFARTFVLHETLRQRNKAGDVNRISKRSANMNANSPPFKVGCSSWWPPLCLASRQHMLCTNKGLILSICSTDTLDRWRRVTGIMSGDLGSCKSSFGP